LESWVATVVLLLLLLLLLTVASSVQEAPRPGVARELKGE
jgi:hypothetical protein